MYFTRKIIFNLTNKWNMFYYEDFLFLKSFIHSSSKFIVPHLVFSKLCTLQQENVYGFILNLDAYNCI